MVEISTELVQLWAGTTLLLVGTIGLLCFFQAKPNTWQQDLSGYTLLLAGISGIVLTVMSIVSAFGSTLG